MDLRRAPQLPLQKAYKIQKLWLDGVDFIVAIVAQQMVGGRQSIRHIGTFDPIVEASAFASMQIVQRQRPDIRLSRFRQSRTRDASKKRSAGQAQYAAPLKRFHTNAHGLRRTLMRASWAIRL